jgi:16S rRNA (guanine527-N7)-methyltransferase
VLGVMQGGAPTVSRETAERLEVLAALVRKWNPAINLVAGGSLSALWDRHIADSLQLVPLAGRPRLWCDLGSGGGFPGLVVAAVLAETTPEARVYLVESDGRKAAFLRTAAQAMALQVTVHAQRAEVLAPLRADVVSARALAPLSVLLPLVRRHLAPGGLALLPKGGRHADEVAAARRLFTFALTAHPSATSPDGSILAITEIGDA